MSAAISDSGLPTPPEVPARAGIRFDPTLNIGHVLTVTVTLGTLATAYFGLKTDLSSLAGQQRADAAATERRLGAVEASMARMTDILVADARQDGRILGLEKRVDRLEATPLRVRPEAEAR
jgi:hypothetical protein